MMKQNQPEKQSKNEKKEDHKLSNDQQAGTVQNPSVNLVPHQPSVQHIVEYQLSSDEDEEMLRIIHEVEEKELNTKVRSQFERTDKELSHSEKGIKTNVPHAEKKVLGQKHKMRAESEGKNDWDLLKREKGWVMDEELEEKVRKRKAGNMSEDSDIEEDKGHYEKYFEKWMEAREKKERQKKMKKNMSTEEGELDGEGGAEEEDNENEKEQPEHEDIIDDDAEDVIEDFEGDDNDSEADMKKRRAISVLKRVSFNKETIRQCLLLGCKKKGTTIGNQALAMMTELAGIYVVETLFRAAANASREKQNCVTMKDFTDVLPSIFLQFR